jgi:hypothetical protein
MLSTFRTFGALSFYVTITDVDGNFVAAGERTFEKLSSTLPTLLSAVEARRCKVIVRPITSTPLIQLDDLSTKSAERVRDVAFLVLETSRGNFQAWLSVADQVEATRGCLIEILDADPNASGSARVAGSINFKRKYAPGFTTVLLIEAAAGRTTTAAELLELGLIAEEKTAESLSPRAPSRGYQSRTWPLYSECIDFAPQRNSGEGKDVSRADWRFALIAADRGFSAVEIADRLMILSEKVKAKKRGGRRYAERTAQNAMKSVDRNRRQ